MALCNGVANDCSAGLASSAGIVFAGSSLLFAVFLSQLWKLPAHHWDLAGSSNMHPFAYGNIPSFPHRKRLRIHDQARHPKIDAFGKRPNTSHGGQAPCRSTTQASNQPPEPRGPREHLAISSACRQKRSSVQRLGVSEAPSRFHRRSIRPG